LCGVNLAVRSQIGAPLRDSSPVISGGGHQPLGRVHFAGLTLRNLELLISSHHPLLSTDTQSWASFNMPSKISLTRSFQSVRLFKNFAPRS